MGKEYSCPISHLKVLSLRIRNVGWLESNFCIIQILPRERCNGLGVIFQMGNVSLRRRLGDVENQSFLGSLLIFSIQSHCCKRSKNKLIYLQDEHGHECSLRLSIWNGPFYLDRNPNIFCLQIRKPNISSQSLQ